jgi:hypothetical protein
VREETESQDELFRVPLKLGHNSLFMRRRFLNFWADKDNSTTKASDCLLTNS